MSDKMSELELAWLLVEKECVNGEIIRPVSSREFFGRGWLESEKASYVRISDLEAKLQAANRDVDWHKNVLCAARNHAEQREKQILILDSENQKLKALLGEAVEVIEFYGSGAHWTATEDTDLFIKITSNDWVKREGGWFCGGNHAEQFLAKLQEGRGWKKH